MAVSINTLYEEGATPSKARTRAAERAGAMAGKERQLLQRVEVKGVELETLIRKNGRIQSYDLRSLVERVEAAGSCSANHALLILRCCGAVLVDEDPAHRTRLVDYHFQRLQQLCSKFDISHYNTLMKVYLENHAGVSGSEMLSRVLRAGLQPNRVTYQHCLGLYCQAGDLAGALALQDTMVAEGVQLTEPALLSLLAVHSEAGDSVAVADTLARLQKAGQGRGAAAYAAQATGRARGRDAAGVAAVMAEAAAAEVKLDDTQVLQLIIECSKAGLQDQAAELVNSLPKKTGYFQKLRNALPDLVKAGNCELAMDMYLARKVQAEHLASRGQHGRFLVRGMVRGPQPLPIVTEQAIRLLEENPAVAQYLVLESALFRTKEECSVLPEQLQRAGVSELKYIFGRNNNLIFEKLRNEVPAPEFYTAAVNCLNNLHALGVEVPYALIANDVIPFILSTKAGLNGREIAQRIVDDFPFLVWSLTTNIVLAGLLNMTTEEHFLTATGFVLNAPLGIIRPERWNNSLARCFLQTNSVPDLVSILFACSRTNNIGDMKPDQNLEVLFKTLPMIANLAAEMKPDLSPDEVLIPILEELVKCHLGIPEVVIQDLRPQLKTEAAQELLSSAQRNWNNSDDYWTTSEEQLFLDQRRELNRAMFHSVEKEVYLDKKAGWDSASKKKFSNLPEETERCEDLHWMLMQKGDINMSLVDRLINDYIEQDKMESLLELYEEVKVKPYHCKPTTLEKFVNCLVRHDQSGRAMDIVLEHMDVEGRKIFVSTLMIALAGIARAGQHERVLAMISAIDLERVMMSRGSNCRALLSVYAGQGNDVKVTEVFDLLEEKDVASTDNVVNLYPLVDVHLVKNDLSQAVMEFVRICKIYNKMPAKFELTCRLIEEENVEAIQAVLDASIDIIGEEKSLYDLAFCFISMGRKSQANKLFETPGLRFDRKKISILMNALADSGNYAGCEMLAEVCNSIFGCDRDFVLHTLVRAFQNDAEMVEELWQRIKTEGHVASASLRLKISEAMQNTDKTIDIDVPDLSKTDEIDDIVFRSLASGEIKEAFNYVMGSFDNDNTSLKCKVTVLRQLIKQKYAQEASMLAAKIGNNFYDPDEIHFWNVYEDLLDILTANQKVDFASMLNKKFRNELKRRKRKDFQGEHDETDIDAKAALQENDLAALISVISSGQTSTNCFNEIVQKLLESEKLDEAAEVLMALCENYDFKNDLNIKTVNLFHLLFTKWEETSQIDKTLAMVEKLPKESNAFVKGNIWVKVGLCRSDPDRYLDLLRTEPEGARIKDWMVSTSVLQDAVRRHPSLVGKLKALAVNNVSANGLMAKLCMAEEQFEELHEYMPSVTAKMLEAKHGGVFDVIPKERQMEEALKAVIKYLGPNQDALSNIANNTLSMHKDNAERFARIANTAVRLGVRVDRLATSMLLRLSKNEMFEHHDMARKLLPQRIGRRVIR